MLLSDVRWDLIQVGDVIISEFGMPGKIINLSENSWEEKIIYIKMDNGIKRRIYHARCTNIEYDPFLNVVVRYENSQI